MIMLPPTISAIQFLGENTIFSLAAWISIPGSIFTVVRLSQHLLRFFKRLSKPRYLVGSKVYHKDRLLSSANFTDPYMVVERKLRWRNEYIVRIPWEKAGKIDFKSKISIHASLLTSNPQGCTATQVASSEPAASNMYLKRIIVLEDQIKDLKGDIDCIRENTPERSEIPSIVSENFIVEDMPYDEDRIYMRTN